MVMLAIATNFPRFCLGRYGCAANPLCYIEFDAIVNLPDANHSRIAMVDGKRD